MPEPLRPFTSRLVPLLVDNVDTDQIIPARFLKGTSKAGLGEGLFADWRYDGDGRAREGFVLNRPEMAGRAVLLDRAPSDLVTGNRTTVANSNPALADITYAVNNLNQYTMVNENGGPAPTPTPGPSATPPGPTPTATPTATVPMAAISR